MIPAVTAGNATKVILWKAIKQFAFFNEMQYITATFLQSKPGEVVHSDGLIS